jgi:hypothetical protein
MFLTVPTTPPLPLLLALAGVDRRAVLRRVVPLRFAPLLEELADRVERLRFGAGAVVARVGFLVPFRVDALAELLDRFVPLCGALPAISNPLVFAVDRCVRAYPIAAAKTHCAKTCIVPLRALRRG